MKVVLDPKSNLQTRINETTVDPVVCNIHCSKHEFIVPFVHGKKVLDVGCGAGWGLKILSGHFRQAVGLDGNEKAIEKARNIGLFNTIFRHLDLQEFQLNEQDFETIISVDVIQQIENPDKFLSSIKHHLVENGLFIVITPNAKKTKNTNPVHYREYTHSELVETLNNFFLVLKVYALEKNDLSSRLRFLWKFDPFGIRKYLPKTVCSATRRLFGIPLKEELTTDNYPITTNLNDAYSFVAVCAQKPSV